jgi:glycosyltransferase involved in cell wall biosynthesis
MADDCIFYCVFVQHRNCSLRTKTLSTLQPIDYRIIMMSDKPHASPLLPRIVFLTHAGNPGGAELCGIALCSSLGTDAHFTHFQSGRLSEMFATADISSSLLAMPPQIAKIKREDGIMGVIRALYSAAPFVMRLIRHLRHYKMIVCISQKSFIFSAIAKPWIRRPIVWFMNDLLSKQHFNPIMIRMIVRIFHHAADHIILNSHASYQAWCDAGGRTDRVHVIYPGTNIDAIEHDLSQHADAVHALKQQLSPDSAPLIGIFGRICDWKGQDIFIRALAQVPNVRGIIVGGAQFGEEAYEAQLKQLADTMGVANRVQFLGHQADVIRYMACCDMITHCSTAPEPFGMVIAEAMSCGVPVIISDAGGAREIIMKHPLNAAVPPSDAQQLAHTITSMLDIVAEYPDYAQIAQHHIRTHFSTESMCRQFKHIVDYSITSHH